MYVSVYRPHGVIEIVLLLLLLLLSVFFHALVPGQLGLASSEVVKSNTSFGWGKSGKVTAAGWQVTLCDPLWHVISRSGMVISITNCYTLTLLYLLGDVR